MQNTSKIASIICMLIAVITVLSLSPVSAQGDTLSVPSTVEANAVYFLHLESNQAIVSQNIDQPLYAGSTAKIMAGLIACERLADRMQEKVTVTAKMLEAVGGRRLHIEEGDVLTVEQLLYIALCGSYNDAYDILACYIAGSLDAYVEEMNTRAAALGAHDTQFTDASGVDDSSRTTAKDLSKIAKAAYDNQLYMDITSTTRYACTKTLKMTAQTVSNRNALIYSTTTTQYYNGKCRGMSAGNTPRAGSCVVTVATNGKESYLCIVMGADETDERDFGYVVANRLIDWVYEAYTYMEVISPDTPICTLPVTVSDMTTEVEIRAAESLSCYLPAGLELGKDITYSVRLIHSSLEAPVVEGTMVGYVAILYNGKTVDTLPIYTAGSAERSSFVGSLKRIQALTESRVFRAGAIFFVVVLLAWIITEYILLQRRRHKWDKYFSMKMNPSPTASEKTKKKKSSTLR